MLSACVTLDSRTIEQFVIVLKRNPLGTLPLFFSFYIVAIVLLFPGMVLQVIAGALYGLWIGLFVAWIATSAGQAFAFLLGRYLFRSTVSGFLTKRVPNFAVVENALAQEGWKLVCLLRISPIIPYNVLNYVLAVTSIGFWTFTIASAVSILPYTVGYVYLGSVSSDIFAVLRGEAKVDPGIQLICTVVSAVFIVATGVWLAARSRQTINSWLETSQANPPTMSTSVVGSSV